MNRNGRRALAAIARLPGKRLPVKGWTLITERLHRHIVGGANEAIRRPAYGVSLRLDLTDYVQRSIFYDAYETDELNFMLRILRTGGVVLDVGANVGIFTLVAAGAVGSAGEVHAFEPVPNNYERFIENIRPNGFQNVRGNQAAVGAERGLVTLGLNEDLLHASGAGTSGSYTVGGTLRTARARMVRIDDYLMAQVSGRNTRLLKIDIEGFEPRALAGMTASLSAHRIDVLMMEVSIYNLARHSFTIADLVRPLEATDYRCYRLQAIGWLRHWRYSGEPQVPHRTVSHVGIARHLMMGLQDINRHFNLIAIRGSPPARLRDPAKLHGSQVVADV